MRLKIEGVQGCPIVDFDVPTTFSEAEALKRELKQKVKTLQELIGETKDDETKRELCAQKSEGNAKLMALRMWRRVIGSLEDKQEEEYEQFEDLDLDLLEALWHVRLAIKQTARRHTALLYYQENPLHQQLLHMIDELIRNSYAEEVADDPSVFPNCIVLPIDPPPSVDKSEIWQYVSGMSKRKAVNVIRHKYTDYDRDRFFRPYLVAFTAANMWIADNFPQLADEAIAQIDEKMIRGGKKNV